MIGQLTKVQYSRTCKRFEWLLVYLVAVFKFVHQILGILTKYPTYQIETMGVSVTKDGKFKLYWNPCFFESLKDSEATYVHYHEVLHLVLHHCTKRKGNLLYQNIWNRAHDLAVNELIPEKSFCTAPRDKEGNLIGCHVKTLKSMPKYSDIKERQTAEWYFQYLREKDRDEENKAYETTSGKNGKEGKNDEGTELGSFDSHEGWEENVQADERVRALVREITATNRWGNMTQTDIEIVKAAQIKPIPWEVLMLTWFGNHAQKNKTSTRKRPNRRTGYIHPGTRKGYTDKWLVVVDTSYSTRGYLKIFSALLNQIAEELPIDFAQCDCNVTCEPKPLEETQINFEFKGMGGTDFQPIIDLVDKNDYVGLCIVTDGEAAACTKPKRAEVLWCLPKGKTSLVEWGTHIFLEESI